MRKVTVSAPARLHLGFASLHGLSASEYGALGLAIEQPMVEVKANEASSWSVSGVMREKALQHCRTLERELNLQQPLAIQITETIPAHVGLGSGTQFALAIGAACTKLNDISLPIAKLSQLLGRGERSGIGTAAFSHGGFLVDCDARKCDESRAISKRLIFPENWRIVLVFDCNHQGAHGKTETGAFVELGGFSSDLTKELQNVLTRQVLPALENNNLPDFGQGISTIQKHVGDFFSPIQGGRFLSPEVANILDRAEKSGVSGIGQSSWGPTGFVIMEDEASAMRLQDQLHNDQFGQNISFKTCRARNVGATVCVDQGQ